MFGVWCDLDLVGVNFGVGLILVVGCCSFRVCGLCGLLWVGMCGLLFFQGLWVSHRFLDWFVFVMVWGYGWWFSGLVLWFLWCLGLVCLVCHSGVGCGCYLVCFAWFCFDCVLCC